MRLLLFLAALFASSSCWSFEEWTNSGWPRTRELFRTHLAKSNKYPVGFAYQTSQEVNTNTTETPPPPPPIENKTVEEEIKEESSKEHKVPPPPKQTSSSSEELTTSPTTKKSNIHKKTAEKLIKDKLQRKMEEIHAKKEEEPDKQPGEQPKIAQYRRVSCDMCLKAINGLNYNVIKLKKAAEDMVKKDCEALLYGDGEAIAACIDVMLRSIEKYYSKFEPMVQANKVCVRLGMCAQQLVDNRVEP